MKIKTKTKPYGTDVHREIIAKKYKDKMNIRVINQSNYHNDNFYNSPDFAQIYIDRKDIRKLANYMLKVADKIERVIYEK